MMPARCILAPTDFSPGGNVGVQQAFALCAGRGDTVVLAHVIDVVPPPNPLYAHYAVGLVPTAEQLAQMKAEATRALEALVPPEATGRGIGVRIEVCDGQPAEALVALARRVGADVIAIGDSGRTAVSRTLLGSIANRLVHEAPCSVLVARAKAE